MKTSFNQHSIKISITVAWANSDPCKKTKCKLARVKTVPILALWENILNFVTHKVRQTHLQS